MSEYHEPPEELSPAARDRHRMYRAIIEEFEAVDWYEQRAAATASEEVRGLLMHNRDEELEHAAMALEWVRRNDAVANGHFRTYLFTEGSILDIEEQEEDGDDDHQAAGRNGAGLLS